jgi:anti-sigma-K factor RskA
LDIKEYIASGILELYVLGQLSPEEMSAVEAMQAEHTAVAQEIYEISRTLEQYGQLSSVAPSPGLEDKILSQLSPKSPPDTRGKPKDDGTNNPTNLGRTFTLLITGLALGLIPLFFAKKQFNDELSELKTELAKCEKITKDNAQEIALIQKLNSPNNKIFKLAPTAGFAGVDLYLHNNPSLKQNIIQIIKSPTIRSDQAFQLWALKEGQAPQPMDVFASSSDFVEVGFVDDTKTYAITIEPAGGSQTPTMTNLIGTIGVE